MTSLLASRFVQKWGMLHSAKNCVSNSGNGKLSNLAVPYFQRNPSEDDMFRVCQGMFNKMARDVHVSHCINSTSGLFVVYHSWKCLTFAAPAHSPTTLPLQMPRGVLKGRKKQLTCFLVKCRVGTMAGNSLVSTVTP